MALVTLSNDITDIAQYLAEQLAEGRGGRKVLGESGQAFGWTSGLPPTIADYVAVAPVSGLAFDAVVASPSATPAAIVAPGAAKPNAVTFTTTPVALKKFAGYAEFTLEQLLTANTLASVVYQVLAGQVLNAFEADAMATILAGAGVTAGGADLVAAILDGQSKVLGNGGRPGVLVLDPADYAALMAGNVGGYAGGGQDPSVGPVGTLYGMAVHVTAPATTGTPIVLDPAAVTVGQNEASPVGVVDPFSQSANNKVRLILDLLAATVVSSPGSVAKCVVSGGGARSGGGGGKRSDYALAS